MTTSQQRPTGRHRTAAAPETGVDDTVRTTAAFVPSQTGPHGPRPARHGQPQPPAPQYTAAPRFADPSPYAPRPVAQHVPSLPSAAAYPHGPRSAQYQQVRTPPVAPQYGHAPAGPSVTDRPQADQPPAPRIPAQPHSTPVPQPAAWSPAPQAPNAATPPVNPPAAPTGSVPPSTPAAPPVPARKRRRWPFVVGAIALLLLIVGIANGGGTPATTAPSTAAAPTAAAPTSAAAPVAAAPAAASGKDVITYEITGPAKAGNITYIKDQNMGQEQVNGTKLPWSKTVEFDAGVFSFQPLSLIAQSDSGGSGEITCRILRNGQELTSSTSSGPYAVVTCSAN